MRRLVAIPFSLAALAVLASGCRHDGREMRPALPSQNGSVSTTTASTVPETEDDFFDTVAPVESGAAAAPGGPIEPSTTVASLDGSGTTPPVLTVLTVTAPWRDGGPIDARYTCKGANVSPALTWSKAPVGTQEIAITMIDQDASYDHWTMARIGAGVTNLAEGTPPEGAVEALNGAGAAAYTGPCPPAGTTHTYRITVHYLNQTLLLSSGGPAAAMRTAIDEATIATAQVTGTFTGT